MTRLAFQTEVQGIPGRSDVFRIVVQGIISYHEAPEFREIILREVTRSPGMFLIIDLGKVARIDTAGLAVLIEGLLAGRQRNLQVLLCQPSPSVLRLFRMANLRDVLEASCATPGEIEQRMMS